MKPPRASGDRDTHALVWAHFHAYAVALRDAEITWMFAREHGHFWVPLAVPEGLQLPPVDYGWLKAYSLRKGSSALLAFQVRSSAVDPTMKKQTPALVVFAQDCWKATAARCVGGIIALGSGCTGDGGTPSRVETIAGGWSNDAMRLLLCITQDGRMWLGDSLTELGGPNPCTVDDTATQFHCSAPDAQSDFEGSILASGNQLTLDIAPCPPDGAECRATYVREPSLTCD